jgi:hypothetical protein
MDAATDWVVDGGRYALDFDGSNDHVLTGVLTASGQMSFSFWFFRRNTSTHRFLANRNDAQGTGTGFDIYTVSTNSLNIFNGSNFATSNNAFSNNAWNHAVISCKSTSGVDFFVNGRLSASVSGNATIAQSSFGVFFGRLSQSSESHFSGLMDDIIIWNRIIPSAEANQLYQIGRGGMLTPRQRRRAYFAGVSGLRRRLLLTGQV